MKIEIEQSKIKMSDEELSPEEALLKRQRKEKKDLQVFCLDRNMLFFPINSFFYAMQKNSR